jgi:acetylornithine/N-succinyldiaminopimelate aminotransferase
MLGVEFSFPTKPLMLAMLKRGVLANATAENVLRLVPPLVITEEEMRIVVETISASITDAEKNA